MKLSRFPLSALLDSASGHLEAHLLQKKVIAPAQVVDNSAYTGIIFSGNPHETVPRRLILDDRLTPLERNAWQVFRLLINDDGVTAFPTYDQLRPYLGMQPGKPASRETISKALVTLRLTRWLSLGRRVRNDLSGQVQGNVYLLHDEPVSPVEAIEFDKDYLQLLAHSMQHQNKAIREVAQIAWNEFAADPEVGNRLPSRVEVIEQRLNEQAWVKAPQEARGLQTTELGNRTQQNSAVLPLSSESELSLKPLSTDPVRNPNSYSTYTDTYKDLCKSSVHVLPGLVPGEEDLLKPLKRLPPDEVRSALQAMQNVPTNLKPALIKQWVHRCESGSLRNPLGYLLTLVSSAVRGKFNSNWDPDDKAAPGEIPTVNQRADTSLRAKSFASIPVATADRTPESLAAAKQEISAMMSQLRFGRPNAQ